MTGERDDRIVRRGLFYFIIARPLPEEGLRVIIDSGRVRIEHDQRVQWGLRCPGGVDSCPREIDDAWAEELAKSLAVFEVGRFTTEQAASDK